MARHIRCRLVSARCPGEAAHHHGGPEKDSIMEDIRQRDLGQIPEAELTDEERAELKRRFEEFVGRLRQKGTLGSVSAPKEKQVRPWDPRTATRKH
jgi:hypothetical protein